MCSSDLLVATTEIYTLSLHDALPIAGALSKTRPADEIEATPEHPVERPGGPMVAVCVDRPGTEAVAVATLERLGAKDVSHAEGKWHERIWEDFDPRVPPDRVDEDESSPRAKVK